MLKKRTSQMVHLEAAQAQHEKHQKDQRRQRSLENQNHPKRRSLKIKSWSPSWQ